MTRAVRRAAVVRLGLSTAALTLAASCTAPPGDREIVEQSWRGYQARFIAEDGRVIRPEDGNDTVSEGQAYAMLRAVWMNDQATFDRVWEWSRSHLARTDREAASLWAWHWVAEGGGRVADWNVASDADTDAALALVLAAEVWQRPARSGLPPYDAAARQMIADLLAHVVATDPAGLHLMLPGAWADQRADGRGLVLNPSYLSPAAYRAFAAISGDRRWSQLAEDSYRVLRPLCASGGGVARPVPDWVRWYGAERWSPEGSDPKSGWDAIRVPWRVATDLMWFDAADARGFLSACVEPVVSASIRSGRGIPLERTLDGQSVGEADHPLALAMYAFASQQRSAREALLSRLRTRIVRRGSGLFFGDPDRYYVNSLAYLAFLAQSGSYRGPQARR